MLAIPIEEASAKIRTGGPVDDEEDYALPAWAGVIPMASRRDGARGRPAAARRHRATGLRERLPPPWQPVTAQIGRGVHRPSARRLHLEQLQ